MKKELYVVEDWWNGGEGGIRERFRSRSEGVAGMNECWEWILENTPFSVKEATTNQGYHIVRVFES